MFKIFFFFCLSPRGIRVVPTLRLRQSGREPLALERRRCSVTVGNEFFRYALHSVSRYAPSPRRGRLRTGEKQNDTGGGGGPGRVRRDPNRSE